MIKYNIRWKNEILGAYSFDEIKEQIANGKIGFFHMVEVSPDKWIFVREFLLGADASPIFESARNLDSLESADLSESGEDDSFSERRVARKDLKNFSSAEQTFGKGGAGSPIKLSGGNTEDSTGLSPTFFGYALCGGAFLSPYLFAAALLYIFVCRRKLGSAEALKMLVLAVLMCVFGTMFFNFLLPTLNS